MSVPETWLDVVPPSVEEPELLKGLGVNPFGGIHYQADARLKALVARHGELSTRLENLRDHVDGSDSAIQASVDKLASDCAAADAALSQEIASAKSALEAALAAEEAARIAGDESTLQQATTMITTLTQVLEQKYIEGSLRIDALEAELDATNARVQATKADLERLLNNEAQARAEEDLALRQDMQTKEDKVRADFAAADAANKAQSDAEFASVRSDFADHKAENDADFADVRSSISAMDSKFTDADEGLRREIVAGDQAVREMVADRVQEVQDACDAKVKAEEVARKNKDDDLQVQIDALRVHCDSEDDGLQTNIDNLTSTLNTHVDNIENNIDQVIADAITKHGELKDLIIQEINNSESELYQAITASILKSNERDAKHEELFGKAYGNMVKIVGSVKKAFILLAMMARQTGMEGVTDIDIYFDDFNTMVLDELVVSEPEEPAPEEPTPEPEA